MTTCAHENFEAAVSVGRMTDGEEGDVVYFEATVKIWCKICHRPMQFVGLPIEEDSQGASISNDGQEAKLAIFPVGDIPQPLDDLLLRGFRVKQTTDH
jgi:hypothetical protein